MCGLSLDSAAADVETPSATNSPRVAFSGEGSACSAAMITGRRILDESTVPVGITGSGLVEDTICVWCSVAVSAPWSFWVLTGASVDEPSPLFLDSVPG